MVLGLALFAANIVLRGASLNRHVRARLMTSGVVCAIYALLPIAVRRASAAPGLSEQVQVVLPLLLAFGIINSLVALVINPWRVDRLPDRFPTIVQDAIVIVLFAFSSAVLLQDRVFALTAAGAVVLGLAMQDTLGNLVSGLAIQIEKPFRVGHWVRIADIDGKVTEVTWRATKVRTKSGNFVIVPNSKLSADIIVNYSEPTPETRIEVEVGTSYDNPPNDVRRTILDALRDESSIQLVREPEVLLDNFANSSINYRIRVWTTEFDADERIRDRIRTVLYYAFKRNGIEIPYPIQTEIQKFDVRPPARDFAQDEALLRNVSIFSSLTDEAVAQLAHASRRGLFGAAEVVVRQGEPGASMFVVVQGEVAVVLEPGSHEVTRLGPGGFFGEMSLLTGAPRNATVRTTQDSEVLEIALEPFRTFVLANPAAVDRVGAAVAERHAELARRQSASVAEVVTESPANIVDRIRRFLRLQS